VLYPEGVASALANPKLPRTFAFAPDEPAAGFRLSARKKDSIMKSHFRLFAAAAAALLLSAPAFAQGPGGHGGHAQGNCPHHQATETAVSQALALLGQAKTQNGDQAKATVEKARQQLAEAQKHMSACEEMCETKMGQGHEGGGHSGHNMTPGHPVHDNAPAAAGQAQTVTDPVCGMKIDPKTAAAKSVYAGKTYYFCTKEDKAQFDKDPEKYLKKQG
jgi:YHS domain-containing protein